MAKRKDLTDQFQLILEQYKERYDIDSLTNPNDQANLHTMIRNQIVINTLQERLHQLAELDAVANAMDIKKLNDSIAALIDRNIVMERQLGIDRKTRRAEQEESVVDYINALKQQAVNYLETKFTRVSCPACKIMVGRISGVYDTTYYHAEFQCPQCKKKVTVTRREREDFFDLKPADRAWRKEHPIEIVQAHRLDAPDIIEEDDIILNPDEGLIFDEENHSGVTE